MQRLLDMKQREADTARKQTALAVATNQRLTTQLAELQVMLANYAAANF